MLGVYSGLSFGEQVILLEEMPALPWLGVLLLFVLRLLDRRTTWAGRFRSYPCALYCAPLILCQSLHTMSRCGIAFDQIVRIGRPAATEDKHEADGQSDEHAHARYSSEKCYSVRGGSMKREHSECLVRINLGTHGRDVRKWMCHRICDACFEFNASNASHRHNATPLKLLSEGLKLVFLPYDRYQSTRRQPRFFSSAALTMINSKKRCVDDSRLTSGVGSRLF